MMKDLHIFPKIMHIIWDHWDPFRKVNDNSFIKEFVFILVVAKSTHDSTEGSGLEVSGSYLEEVLAINLKSFP